MSVLNQPGAMLYTAGFGSRPENVEVPVIQNRAPATTDSNYSVGKNWIDSTNNAAYVLTSLYSSAGVISANWQQTGAATGAVASVVGTTNQITVVTSSNVATVSLPSAVTAPGSLATTTTLASGTTLTAGTTFTATGGASSFGGGTFTVASGTNAINISADAAATTVNLATGAAVKTLIIGSTNTTSATTVQSGSGGIGLVGNTSVTGSLTASTTLTATLGAITATNGNLVLGTAGNKIVSSSVATTTTAGANSFGTVTLSSGTATISTTAVTASSIIMLTRQSPGATGAAALGMISVGTISAGVSFVINALTTADATAVATTDVSSIGWMIIN